MAALYVEQYEYLRANPPSDLVADIVADYEVSDAEFAEAQQAFRDCMSSKLPGSNPQTSLTGGYEVTLPDDFVAQFGQGEAAAARSSPG